MKRSRSGLFLLAGIITLIIIGPLVIPFPEVEGIESVENMQYQESQFIEIDGINIHFRQFGEGEPLILLLHGFGSSTYSWEKVSSSLAAYGKVIAYDRPAFGLTERVEYEKGAKNNPYEFDFQISMVEKIMDRFKAETVILIGNSAGGTIAMEAAMQYQERIIALVLVDSAVENGNGAPALIRPLLNTPQMDKLGPIFVRSIQDRGLEILKLAWYDPEKISENDIMNYQKSLRMPNWDLALWEYTKANEDIGLKDYISKINVPVLIISGVEDRLIPADQSVWMADEIKNSKLVLIPECGHVPQEECPEAFLESVIPFLIEIQSDN